MPSAIASRCLVPPHEAAGRRTLRAQVARLETRLAGLVAELGVEGPVRAATSPAGGPRLLDLGELERTRDALLSAIDRARAQIAQRDRRRACRREQLARMLRDPARHPFARVRLADLGEPGCGAYTVRPRLGLLGMLAGWWRVTLSSGCP